VCVAAAADSSSRLSQHAANVKAFTTALNFLTGCNHRWRWSSHQRSVQGQRHPPPLPHSQYHHRQVRNHELFESACSPKSKAKHDKLSNQPARSNSLNDQELPCASLPPPSPPFSATGLRARARAAMSGCLQLRDTGQ